MTRTEKSMWLARIVLVVACLLFLSPFYWMINTALKEAPELSVFPPTLVPRIWKWENFTEAMGYFPFWRYLGNTVLITVLSTIGSVASNFVIAYGFSRIQWKGRDALFGIMLATMFIPFPVTMIPTFIIFAKLGWINTYLPMIVPSFFGAAFSVFLLRQFLMQIPFEISEAARVDGASEFQTMWRIILPLSKPALSVVAIFSALGAWNNFLGPLLYLQDEKLYTLSIGLTAFRSQHDVDMNLLMAASTLVVLPVVVVFFMFQKAFVEGMTLGSIK